MSFYDILQYKMTLKREKELPILDLLTKYKNGTEEEKHNIRIEIMSILGGNKTETDDFLSVTLI